VGAGSEFTAIAAKDGAAVKLRIDKPLGIARSSATIVSPAGAQVRPGDVFELTRLIPNQSVPLRFWVGPSNLSSADIEDAAAQVAASGVATVSDPAEEPYTDVLSWNGTAWTLHPAGTDAAASSSHSVSSLEEKKSSVVTLGAKVSADVLKMHISVKTRLWASLPASKELAGKLQLSDPNSAAQASHGIEDASYVLAGSINKGHATYTWFHKTEYALAPSASAAADHSAGCSATSPYPVRADWVSAAGDAGVAASAEALNTYSTRLAKVHGWIELANNATAGASEEGYFKLALVPAAGAATIDISHSVRESDRFKLALQSDTDVKDARWVYILDIDCHGKGSLVYPQNYSENQYPSEGDNDRQIVLRHAPTLVVGPPYGVDTMILLSTAQPLPDPSVLNFDGVARGATRGVKTPLEQLLSGASSGTRGLGAEVEVPTNWGIQVTSLRSVPKTAAH
jgi:hypothetical protein